MVCSLSHVQLFVTPWTAAHQAPLSMGFPRQDYWSGLPFLPNPEIKPMSPELAGIFCATHWATGEVQEELCCCSVTQLCLTLSGLMGRSTPGCPVLHISWSLLKLMSIMSVMPSNHLVLSRPLLLLPSIFPSSSVFSNELALCIRWSKYCSFSFSISPSNEYSGLISFRTDWFDLNPIT